MAREAEHVILALTKLCRVWGITNILQIGAEDGYEAFFISEALGINAHAIDADPKCAPCAPTLDFYRAYIGAKNEKSVPFYTHTTSGLSSPYKRGNNEKERAYNMVTLDTFCDNTKIRPDALIIDTEGSTYDVLKGATRTLRDVILIYAEVQARVTRPGIHPVKDVEHLLFPLGFCRYEELPSYDLDKDQFNMTYVRA